MSAKLSVLYLVLLMTLAWFSRPAVGQTITDPLLITEVYYDAPGRDESGEWVEIANLGEVTIALGGYKLADAATPTSREGAVQFPADAMLLPGEAAVIARSATGYRALFGVDADFEIDDTSVTVPDMRRYTLWGTGDFALANDGDEIILLGPADELVDAVNYGDRETFFHPAVAGIVTGQSIERVPVACDSDSAADWLPRTVPTPGEITLTGECRTPPDPTADLELLTIGEIQGASDISPYINQTVSFTGRVTGFLADRNVAGVVFYTLFVQEVPGSGDADPATSDGIALFLGTAQPRFSAGDDLLITGQVTEFFGFTEIDNNDLEMTLLSQGNPLPETTPLEPERMIAEGATYLETLESMYVSFPAARVVGPTLSFCTLSVLPASSPITRVLGGPEQTALLPVLHTSDVDCTGLPDLKVGDEVSGLAGPLAFHFDLFKLVHQEPARLVVSPAPLLSPPQSPDAGEDAFSIATFNLGDYIEPEREAGQPERPAEADDALLRKRQKLATAIGRQLRCPTLLAVQEVGNHRLLQELALAVEPACNVRYTPVHLDSPDARGIDVALLIDSRRVSIEQVSLHQACTSLVTDVTDRTHVCRAGESALFSRPPLWAVLQVEGHPVHVVVNHFKSKREGEAETAARRLAQAQHVAGLTAAALALEPNAFIIVTGDFNDGPDSPTLHALLLAGQLADALTSVPSGSRYSYNFAGVSELLDGILLSPAAMASLRTADILHLNVDYPAAWADDLRTPFRSSDHDIPMAMLALPAPAAPTPALTPIPTVTDPPPTSTAEIVQPPENTRTDVRDQAIQPAMLLAGGGAALFLLLAGALLFRRAGR